MTHRVLIIEDDPLISRMVEDNLVHEGFDVRCVADGDKALSEVRCYAPDMILLDLMLPGLDGFEICRALKQSSTHIPIIVVSARSEAMDRIQGLNLGADDYLTKPFGVRELVARVKAIFRRLDLAKQDRSSEQKEICIGELNINPSKRRVILGERKIEVTAKEFDLLYLFMKSPGRTYSRQELLDVVWGYQFDGYDHTVNTHINRLRTKIEEDASKPKYILTVWGVGYRFAEAEELAPRI